MTGKIFHDSIHGYIQFHPLCMLFIDTEPFQRLRFLRQIGNVHYVYPMATHNRFQHSLGVGYLAEKFARKLQLQFETEFISEKDVHCVTIAGLCHDLGHGPWSHNWEMFMKEAAPKKHWSHENTSISMFNYLVDKNALRQPLMAYGLDENDLLFIQELIAGPIFSNDSNYVARGSDKHFLYEIVANKYSGIDVDKFDYFLRDNNALQIGALFQYDRYMEFVKVLNVNGVNRLCIRDSEVDNLKALFEDRNRLHKLGYQHRVVLIVDTMLLDALLLADKYLVLPNSKVSLSAAVENMSLFCQLEDEFVKFLILTCELAKDSKEILKRISRREFYRHLVSWTPTNVSQIQGISGNDLLELCIKDHALTPPLQKNDFVIIKKNISTQQIYSDKIFFYNKFSELVALDLNLKNKNEITFIFCCRSTDYLRLQLAQSQAQVWLENLSQLNQTSP